MSYHIYEETRYDKDAQKSVPVAWTLTWDVYTNNPRNNGNYGNRVATIAGQSRKRYGNKADMEKYLAGRIKTYSHLFTEISPPIPPEYAKVFAVNGKLLPGYTVQGGEPPQTLPPERAADIGGVTISEPKFNEPRKEQISMYEPLNIQLSNREQYENGSMGGAWLKLPATAEQLNAALARIGVTNGEQGKDFFITASERRIPGLTREMVNTADLNELNHLAAALRERDDWHIAKLNAAIEMMGGVNDVHSLTELTQNTGFYDFYPDIFSNIQLGEHRLEHSRLIQIPDEWAAAVDIEMLGQLAAASEKGKFTEYGYIAPSGEEWKPINEIPKEYQIAVKSPRQEHKQAAPPAHTNRAEAAAAPVSAAHEKAAKIIPLSLTAENPRDRMKEATAKLEAGIKGIFDSEQYKTYLKTLSKFHNYSANNCILIAMQCPGASRIAGFNDWRDKFKRPVMKGEKGIKIFAPAPFKTKKEVDKLDRNGKPVIGKDGKRVKDAVEVTVPAFKIATVFDVSQTDGEPLPQLGVSELTGSVDRYKEIFAALEKTSPVPIAFENITSGAKGYCNYEEKRIAINEGMSELQNLKTLIHEIAHARLHAIDPNIPIKGQNLPDKRDKEVQAESIAYAVCQHYGLDTSDYSFGYVASWSGAKQLDALKSSLETIRKEADAIITEVDKNFPELEREQAAERPVPEKQPGHDTWSEPATAENAPETPGVPSDDIGAYLPKQAEQGDIFTIYQLKDGEQTQGIRFEPLAAVAAAGRAVELANYNSVYTAPLDNTITLEKIFFTLNMDKPEDFKGHALSVSDVVVMNRDGKETAFYVDGKGFQKLPNFLAPRERAKAIAAEKPIDLAAVADYMNKIRDSAMNADPGKTQGAAAFNMAIKRLEQSSERIPGTQPQLKALISHAAQSPDIAALRERMNTLHTEFIQHFVGADSVSLASPQAAKLNPSVAPPLPTQSTIARGPLAAPKDPPRENRGPAKPQGFVGKGGTTERADNGGLPSLEHSAVRSDAVAAIEAQVKAGETIDLTNLSEAIKKDKAAQTAKPEPPAKANTRQTPPQQPPQGAKQPYSRGKSAYAPSAPKNPSIRDKIQAGKDEIAAKKNAPSRSPQRAAAPGKNAGLGD